jgi:hypothetical protein
MNRSSVVSREQNIRIPGFGGARMQRIEVAVAMGFEFLLHAG